MLGDIDFMIKQEHINDLIAESNNERRAIAATRLAPAVSIYNRSMIWIGKQLVSVGMSLQGESKKELTSHYQQPPACN